MSALTPMMQQYHEIKSQCKDAILFFRLGDFYEMFGQDAIESAKILDITLTSRSKDENAVPMCGVPYHSAETYIARLTKAGKKVAICDQMSDPALPGIVERKIVRIITPGTTFSEQVLNRNANRYIMSIFPKKDYFGIAFADLTTGEFYACEFQGFENLKNEILRINPAEIVLHVDHYNDAQIRATLAELSEATVSSTNFFDEASQFLMQFFNVRGLDAFGIGNWPFAIQASGVLLKYLVDTQKDELYHIDRILSYHREEWMELDESTIHNLELFTTMRDHETRGTLLSVIDQTLTGMGGRMLRSWLTRPLLRREEILPRQLAVENLVNDFELRADLEVLVSKFYDLERLLGRLSSGLGNARDLLALNQSLLLVPEFKKVLGRARAKMLTYLGEDLYELEELVSDLSKAVMDEPSLKLLEGNIIKEGWNPELDELRGLMRDGRRSLKEIEEKEIAATGINSLKVSYNRVFGYYIEVSRVNLAKVPETYIRKQTLANAERFITPELKTWEEKVLNAEARANELEYEIFLQLRTKVLQNIKQIKQNARALAECDVLLSFAKTAVQRNYVKPFLTSERKIEITGGRHPVVESITFDEAFIPNDTTLEKEETEIMLITGPNMSGKSTYLRQVALIAILNQIGSFVPASAAVLPVFDRIFTRVGASDNLVRGHSTFMVEMQESAYILNHATERSLIILDEVGRGTSTYDGLSLAWSILEYLHDEIRSFALFATHYHELISVAEKLPRVKNYSIDVIENKKGVLFLHKIVEGGISKSYGIEVAKLAALPSPVIERAAEILKELEADQIRDKASKIPSNQLGLFNSTYASSREPGKFTHPALEKLKSIDINEMTPIEALVALNELKKIKE